MNIFYAPPSQMNSKLIELTGQEAKHASKVLRYKEGDPITVVDGQGGWYEGKVARIMRDVVQVQVKDQNRKQPSKPELVMAFGIIKKRDRLEFAVEKAVELGADKILLFRSEHTVKENVRMDRLESTALAAMKQSLRAYLPQVVIYSSLREALEQCETDHVLVAHEKVEGKGYKGIPNEFNSASKLLLLVGPEGGFSVDEISFLHTKGAEMVLLGHNRLRTETAVAAFLSQFI